MRTTYAFRYGWLRPLLSLLGMGPAFSQAVLDEDALLVTMGWSFRSRIPRSSITRVYRDRNRYGGIGVHGWGGRWLVNGSVTNIVTIEIEPPLPSWVLGLPLRLRRLHLSLVDPDGFVAALGTDATGPN